MKLSRTTVMRVFGLVCLLHFFVPREALGYLDPGSASFVLQMLIAAFVTAGFVVKTFWARIRSFLGGSAAVPESGEEASDESPSGE